jgi:hypothetical protein
MLAAATYLANKPDGGVLVCLVIAVVCFVIAAVVAAWLFKAFWATLVCAGFVFLTLAFMLK